MIHCHHELVSTCLLVRQQTIAAGPLQLALLSMFSTPVLTPEMFFPLEVVPLHSLCGECALLTHGRVLAFSLAVAFNLDTSVPL